MCYGVKGRYPSLSLFFEGKLDSRPLLIALLNSRINLKFLSCRSHIKTFGELLVTACQSFDAGLHLHLK